MASKGDETKSLIRDAAQRLFAVMGYKDVTMSDICAVTGLSRGGLYRHYSSTTEIFKELIRTDYPVDERIGSGERASDILFSMLDELEAELVHNENSLGLAIYEYAMVDEEGVIKELAKQLKNCYVQLIKYGIQTCEFAMVDADEVADMILFYYQGLLMWSRTMDFDSKIIAHYKNSIKKALGI